MNKSLPVNTAKSYLGVGWERYSRNSRGPIDNSITCASLETSLTNLSACCMVAAAVAALAGAWDVIQGRRPLLAVWVLG